jgi:8-oxo-dGTP diphosphatase
VKQITKVGLAVVENDRLLLVRKRGTDVCILPGGKPEGDEDDVATLRREIDEELGCRVDETKLVFVGAFTDRVAGLSDTMVTVRLYCGDLVGHPKPQSEIEHLVWFSPQQRTGVRLAPSLDNQIVPLLISRLALSAP